MRVLIIGGGGREHALAWKLAQSQSVTKLYCAPGNPGIGSVRLQNGRTVECLPISVIDRESSVVLCEAAIKRDVGLIVVGPEAPLALGITDMCRAAGMAVFGHSKNATQLESSKVFSKELMWSLGIRTPYGTTVRDPRYVQTSIDGFDDDEKIVVKANGLAGGKGVFVCATKEIACDVAYRLMRERCMGEAGASLVLEQFLEGQELSFHCFVDGETIMPIGYAEDHKRLYDDQQFLACGAIDNPNTGGMGATAPIAVSPDMHAYILEDIVEPVVVNMAKKGMPLSGVLFAGLIVVSGKVYALEFNVRFGDPETQPLLVCMKSELFPYIYATATGSLKGLPPLEFQPGAAACVVLASEGYPHEVGEPALIRGLHDAEGLPGVQVFHAGTRRTNRWLYAIGGRTVGVTACGSNVTVAAEKAYSAIETIRFNGLHYRRDIGIKIGDLG